MWELMRRFKDAIGKISYSVDPNHQRDWFIKALPPLTQTPLTQQKIDNLQDALEQAMKIEAMAGYPQEYLGGAALQDPSLLGLQHQIANLTKKLKEMQPIRPARLNVLCTHCLVEGHVATECPRLRSPRVGALAAAVQGALPIRGVAQIKLQGVYPPQQSYAGFPNQPTQVATEFCEICRMVGHQPQMCRILEKCSNVLNNVYGEFCASKTHGTEQCRALDALVD